MRFKGTIFLTALLISLGFYLYFVEFPAEKERVQAEIKKGKLFSFAISEISRINIKNSKGAVEFEYFPDHPTSPWRIFQPVETIANKYAADDLALLLENLKASRLVEENPTELTSFGLDPPAYRVLITINTFDTLIVDVGDENLTGSDVYVQTGMGTGLFLVPASIKQVLDKDLKAWRQREVFPSPPEDIRKIRITSARGTLDIKRESDGWSVMSNPSKKEGGRALGARGDRSEIANLLGSLLNIRGDDFIDFGKERQKAQFGPPLLKITLKISEVEREATFFKDDSIPGVVFITTAPFFPIFQIANSDLKTLDQPFEIYRDKHLVALEFPDQIAALTIDRPEGSFSLKREEGIWMTMGKNPKEVTEVRNISRLLSDLYHLRLDTFRDDIKKNGTETGLKNPKITIHLQDKENEPLGEIVFGTTKGEMVFGKSSGQPYPFLLKKTVLARIPYEKDLFKAHVKTPENATP